MLRLTFQPNKEHQVINHDSWTLDSIVEDYKQHERRVRGLREPTLKSYEQVLRPFLRLALGEVHAKTLIVREAIGAQTRACGEPILGRLDALEDTRMNMSSRRALLVHASLGCILGLAVTASRASDNDANGKNQAAAGGPYWACAVSVKGVQYESAIFSQPNLFPQQIYSEYFGYVSKKHQGGMPNCESRPTRAEAETFLAQYAAGTIPGAASKATRRVATGWIPHQLGGPPIEEPAAAPPPAAPPPQGPTTFYACKSNKESEHTEYTSAAFQAETGQASAIGKAFNIYLIGMFGHEGVIECPQFSTLDKAKEWLNQRRIFAIRNHSSIETTHWNYP